MFHNSWRCHRTRNQRSKTINVPTVFLFILCTALAASPADALEIENLWVADPDMIMEGPAMVVDLDGDGDAEIITAAYENIIVVDGTGEELWRFDTKGRYSTCPAVLERPDKPPLIYAGDNKGMFTCLDGEGNVVWQVDLPNVFGSAPALADLNNDDTIELIQGNQSGVLFVLDALTGDRVWEKQLEGACSSPAVADLDGDNRLEVVVATGAGKLFALDASGDMIWEHDLGGTAPFWAIPSPVVFADSAGRTCIAIACHTGRFFCLDNQGRVLWDLPTRGPVASTISVGDFDIDGRADLFVVTELGMLHRFNEDGRMLWEIDTQGRSLAPGAIVDVDGDGTLEYMLCTQRGNLLVFDNAGQVVFDHQFNNRTINVTAAFGDIVRERPGLEFAITGGEAGQIFCFGIPTPIDCLKQWCTYRGDNRLTGVWFGLTSSHEVRMTPENLEWDKILVGDEVTFRIVNPNSNDTVLKAQSTCIRPDGSRHVAVGKVVGGRGLLKLPVSITVPGVYRFEWMLKNASDSVLAFGSREMTLRPYGNDQALAKRAVLALQKTIGSEKGSGIVAVMNREAQAIEEEATALEDLQVAAPGSPPSFRNQLDTRTAALNTRAKRALALGRTAESILTNAPGNRIVAFEGRMWENRDVDKQLPVEAEVSLQIARRCIPGEHEPVSIKLLNVTLDSATVPVRVQTKPGGGAVTVYEVKPVPTNQGTTAWDPIVPLDNGTIVVPPLEAREIWLDIDLLDTQAGRHAVEVVIDTGAIQTKAEIVLDVLPFEMAGFGAMRLCCWASYNDDAVRDLLAHGNNVFTTGLPPASVEEGQNPRIDIDFTALDEFTARLEGHDVFLLMGGIPSLGVPVESDVYCSRVADYFDRVMSHLEDKGIDEDHVALYPHDEPGGHGWDTVNHYIAFARQCLKVRPGLSFYVNGGGDLAMFEALNEVTSIWCPGFYGFTVNTPETEFIKKSGKTIWTYDCGYSYARPIGPNTKTINVVAQYRLAAVHGYNFGATGIGYWCYNAGESVWEPVKHEYPLVYANPDGTHTSCRRWEAVRESMEDTRILIALREKLQDASVSPAAKRKIRHLLETTVAGISEQALAVVHLGLARYALDASNNDDTVKRLRDEMMDCVSLLAQ